MAIDTDDYLEKIKTEFGLAGRYREVMDEHDLYKLQEPGKYYMVHLAHKKQSLIDDTTIELE